MRLLIRGLLALWMWLHRVGHRPHRLSELDERAIRDIGLEAWRSPLGAEGFVRKSP
jgi:hypothetical protein